MDEMTFKRKLHTILCVNGGISDCAINMMSGSFSYKRKSLSEIKKKGLIEKKNKTIRLTTEGTESALWRDGVKEEYLILAKDSRELCRKSTANKLRRNLYHSEVLCAMMESGVEIYLKDVKRIPPYPSYIPGKRIKEAYKGDKQAIKRSRTQGTLFDGNGNLYNVYAMGRGTITWNHTGEAIYKKGVEQISFVNTGKRSEAGAIILAEDMDNLKRIPGPKKGKIENTQIGTLYKNIYLYPKDENGIQMLEMLLLPGVKAVTQEIAEELESHNFLLPDILKLKTYSKLKRDHKRVCCLKEYEKGIKELIPEAEIVVIPIEKVVSIVLGNGDMSEL